MVVKMYTVIVILTCELSYNKIFNGEYTVFNSSLKIWIYSIKKKEYLKKKEMIERNKRR